MEPLEDRLAPANFFPANGPDLRAAVITANTNGDASNTITLTTANYDVDVSSREASGTSDASIGDIDIKYSVPKTLIIQGEGPGFSVIRAAGPVHVDRIFEITNSNATVTFKDLTITGGVAHDAGSFSISIGSEARGGNVLNNGGALTLDHVVVSGGTAQGDDGVAVSNAGNGGFSGFGGGVYSTGGGKVTVQNSWFLNNQAIGGRGADGSGAEGASINGGNGGGGIGGGFCIIDASLTSAGASGSADLIITNTVFISNSVSGGNGANGANGSNGGAGLAGIDAVGPNNTGGVGGSGGAGGAGGRGGNGGNALGGALYLASGSVDLSSLTIQSNQANAGNGGTGAQGGNGGTAGAGGNGFSTDGSSSGNGGAGGRGGRGGNGGDGGSGGNADGGGLYVASGAVTLATSTLDSNRAFAGFGGNGSVAGNGGTGGAGGRGGNGHGGTSVFPAGNGGVGGAGGPGGPGGDAGAGGRGGDGKGGGAYLASGSLDIQTSTFSSNQVQGRNGGNGASGGSTSSSSSAFGNGGPGGAGGAGGNGGSISGSGQAGNGGNGGPGGAGGNGGRGGNAGPGGDGYGGGIYSTGGTLTLTNSTVSANNAAAGLAGAAGVGGNAASAGNGGNPGNAGAGGEGAPSPGLAGGSGADGVNGAAGDSASAGDGEGGGVGIGASSSGQTADFRNSTIAFNTAATIGGGVFSDRPNDGSVRAVSTIFAKNGSGAEGSPGQDFAGNVEASASLFLTAPTGAVSPDPRSARPNITSVDPNLQPLNYNGGPTRNHAILASSAAFDKGVNFLSLASDQRVYYPRQRPGPNGTDIGAFNVGILDVTKTDNYDDITPLHSGDTIHYTITINNFSSDNLSAVELFDFPDSNTTMVPGTLKATPVAEDDGYDFDPDIITLVPSPGPMVNDFDPDGPSSALTIDLSTVARVAGTIVGSLDINADGSFSYDAPANTGFETFRYKIKDGDGLESVSFGFFTINVGTVFLNTPPAATLIQAQLDGIVAAAKTRWSAFGLTSAQQATLGQFQFSIADLGPNVLATSDGARIVIDDDAGGNGWFVDPTPGDNSEFTGSPTTLTAGAGPAADGLDLLTTVLREMHSALGVRAADAPDLLSQDPTPGERLLPPDNESLRQQLRTVEAAYGFHSIGSYYANQQGVGEKWMYDRANNWFAITPDGAIHQWNNISFASSPVVAHVPTDAYAHPELLFGVGLSQAQQAAVDQIQGDHGFHFSGSYYQNHQGVGEKWMYDRANNWFAITPDGAIHQWNNVSFASSPVVGTVAPTVYDRPELLFGAGLSQAQRDQMNQVQADHGFRFIGSYYQNYQGAGEKWMYDRAYHWFAITPDGSIRQWNNASLASSPVVATVAPAVYDHPDWLFAAGGALAPSLQDQLNQVQNDHGFHPIGNYYQNHQGAGEKWIFDRANNWFAITPDGAIRQWNNQSFAGSPIVATVTPAAYDSPNLLFNAHAPLVPTVLVNLARFQHDFGFHPLANDYRGHAGFNEKWINDRNGNWFALTPDGDLVQWNGKSFASSPHLAHFAPAVYDNPNLLFAGNVLTSLAADSVNQSELNTITAAAIQRWSDTGLLPAQLTTLHNLSVQVGDLAGSTIGVLNSNGVVIDKDAGGRGWFIDHTPLDDVEFGVALGLSRRGASPGTDAVRHEDLLTTVMHEMGHALGLADTYQLADRDNLMYGYLPTSERRLPAVGQAPATLHAAVLGDIGSAALLFFSSLPTGKSVQVFFDVTVNNPVPAGVHEVVNQASVSAGFGESESISKLSDDPDDPTSQTSGSPDSTRTPVETSEEGCTPEAEAARPLICRWRAPDPGHGSAG